MENNPRNVFERLFGASDSTDTAVRMRRLKTDASILDSITEQVGGVKRGRNPGRRPPPRSTRSVRLRFVMLLQQG